MEFKCGRHSGKRITEFVEFCEMASELQSEIEFAKKFNIECNEKQVELMKIYKILDRGKKNERKETKWRLL